MLDFGFMTAAAMLEAPKAAESIGRICIVITSWACRDKVSKVNIIRLVIATYYAGLGAIVSCTSMIPLHSITLFALFYAAHILLRNIIKAAWWW
jgi:hypothetical protein